MRRWRICTLGKTDVYLHPAMLLYLLYAHLTGHGHFICLSILSILLHEGAHALTSTAFGHMPSCMELTPLGAVMRLEDENRLPFVKRVLMLLAGPSLTFLLCYAAIHLTIKHVLSPQTGQLLFMSNLSILLLNLLPVLPLDGGRILSLILGLIWPARIVNRIMRCIGSILGMGLIGLNIYVAWKSGGWNLSLAFAGCCMLYSSSIATVTQAVAELRQFMDRKIQLERRGSMASTLIYALSDQSLRKLVRMLPPGKIATFVCVEAGSMKLLGWLSEYELIQQYLNQPDIKLSNVINLCQNSSQIAKYDTI